MRLKYDYDLQAGHWRYWVAMQGSSEKVWFPICGIDEEVVPGEQHRHDTARKFAFDNHAQERVQSWREIQVEQMNAEEQARIERHSNTYRLDLTDKD